ncbi:type 2 isopentenyl-diphosphate Delta-isomerase [Picosynechococcus sp. NKBG15041c]|uniref:type 2 isopentenyl-diphosphate Delta-isomerase n=1 Tax=Picosynechococcus sp. NKBG15041c TaxID=1407650 RepID=UPI000464A9A1|nr:type 2 isopentenyl-diphosphate Delta-isomerase [Picosynechococcus sp. NKBG15041c]
MTDSTQARKADHIRICLEEDVQFHQNRAGFERYRFEHCCLPELDRNEIDLSTTFLSKTLGAPILISSMTGGTAQAQEINYRLAEIAQTYRLAMGVGSQRVAIEKPEVAATFAVRQKAPDALLFANIGAVQLNYGYGVAECRQLVDLLEADALILHLNPLQECIQPQGDTNFKGLLQKIEQVCQQLDVPVIAKEVGNGISVKMVQRLREAGVQVIDVAGAGGTSWAKVEAARSPNALLRHLGHTFGDWGIPTADCLAAIAHYDPQIPLIASGGLRNGLDGAKAIALGADLVGYAQPFLKAACESPAALAEWTELLLMELRTALFCTGNANFQQLQRANSLYKL